jgi:glycosyltransferase involved in cell wall biosynthesis
VKVTVVVPAYNEEGNILQTAEKIHACFQASSFQGELIFVDDGSVDQTYPEMQEAARRCDCIRLLRHRRNRGLTEALKTGFANMTGDVVIFLPADLQYDPGEAIPKLVGKIAEGYDVAAGYKEGEDHGWRALTSEVSNSALQWLFGISVRNMNAVRAFRREVLEDLHLRSERHSLMLPLAAAKGYTISEVPVALYPRIRGESKFHLSSFVLASFDLIAVRLLISFSQRPILLFGLIATVFFTIAFG